MCATQPSRDRHPCGKKSRTGGTAVAPEVAEDLEARLLAQEEARAAETVFLRTRRRGDGTTDRHLRVSDLTAARLLTSLHAYTSPRREPRRPQGGGPPAGPREDRRPYDQRLGAAVADFLEDVDPARMPIHGGDATIVMVTIDLDQLRTDLGVAHRGDEP
ncbi:MAG TPA: hypothetical protein VFT70_09090 [Nocardioides sp.]|nr:hypothetical protein [Nocardioides sp.]